LSGFASHTLFVLDRENFGNSFVAERRSDLISVLFQVIGAFPFVLLSGWRFLEFKHATVDVTRFGFALLAAGLALKDLYNMRELRMEGVGGRDATEEDIARDPTCLVCRGTMEVGSAKVLACGHCFHAECLERWLARQHTCPLCSESVM
jgi:E3 ubiquitin-protein ligase synoviolin